MAHMNSAREFTRAAFTKWLGMHDMTDRGRDPEITDPRNPHKRRLDVAAELDAHIHDASNSVDYVIEWRRTLLIGLLQRARDEIVALREMRDAHIRILSARLDEDEENMRRWIAKARAEVLEEATHECDEEAKGSAGEVAFRDGCETCAAAIRLLKEKRDE